MKNTSWLLIGLAAGIAFVVLVMSTPGADAWQSGSTYVSNSGSWTISTPTVIADETVVVNGNINVQSTLFMYNAGIQMSLGADKGYYICVTSTGNMHVFGSTVGSTNTGLHYPFYIYGASFINQSTVKETWGSTSSWDGGIQIRSNNTKITNSTIASGKTGGIYIYRVTAQIYNNIINNNGNDGGSSTYAYGIYVESNGNTTVNGTTQTNITFNQIYNNQYVSGSYYYGTGIRSLYQGGNDLIGNNTIYNNGFSSSSYVYNYGTQVYLYYSGPSLNNNTYQNGRYGLYAYYSYPPLIGKGNLFTMYTYYYTQTYAVYGTNSGLQFDGITFKSTWSYYDEYGIYVTSYSWLNVTNCTFDYTASSNWYTHFNIWADSYCSVNVTNTAFKNYYCSAYNVYLQYYCSLNITNCTSSSNQVYVYGVYAYDHSPVNITGFKLANQNGYPVYGVQLNYYCNGNIDGLNISGPQMDMYAVQAYSYCTVDFKNGVFSSTNGYSMYLFQMYDHSPLTAKNIDIDMISGYSDFYLVQADNSEIRIDNLTGYIQTSGYSTQLAYNYNADMFFSNLTLNFVDFQGYYFYGFQSNNADITINDSRIIHTNDQTYYEFYGIQMYAGDVYCRNLTWDYQKNSPYQWYSTYFINLYDYNWGGQGGWQITVLDSNITIGCNDNLQMIYTYSYTNGPTVVSMKNTKFNMKYYGQNWFSCFNLYNCRSEFDNCTIYMDSQSTYEWSGGEMFYYGGYYNTPSSQHFADCTISLTTSVASNNNNYYMFDAYSTPISMDNCVINMTNEGGFNNVQIVDFYNYAAFEANDTTFELYYGGDPAGAGGSVQPFYFYQALRIDFTRCTINVTVDQEPITMDTFFFEYDNGDLNINGTKISWDITGADSVVNSFVLSENQWNLGSLVNFKMNDSELKMVVNAPNVGLSILSLTEQTKVENMALGGLTVNLTMLVASATPNTAIDLVGLDAFDFPDLTLELNAPAGSDTMLIGLRLERTSPDMKNLTVKGNGQGQIVGIVAQMASSPTIDGGTISGVAVGVYSDFFSKPVISSVDFSDSEFGAMVDNYGNITLMSCTVSTDTAVAITNGSWATIIDSSLQGATTDLDLNAGSVAWLLNSTFTPAKVNFGDDECTLIVNWWLQLKVTWQNDAIVQGANVVVWDAKGTELLRTASDNDGIVGWFVVEEYEKTRVATDNFSPYRVNATYRGFSAEKAVTTDKSKEEQIKLNDDKFPVLTVMEPNDPCIQNHTTVVFRGTASDLGSGIGMLRFSHDGSAWTDVQATERWEFTADIPEGTWNYSISLVDRAGNVVTAQRVVIIDLTTPFINIQSPADNSLGNLIGVKLVGSVEKGAALLVNQKPVKMDANGSFSYDVRLVEGKNQFQFFARDAAGNTNSTTWTLFLDVTPPPLKVYSPVDGLITNKDSVTVTGLTEPGATITVDGNAVTVEADGTFSYNLTLARGAHPIVVNATDAVGNQNTVRRNILMDNEIRLAVTEPASETTVTNIVIILIRGTTDTDVGLRLNDGLVTVNLDGTFSITYALTEGANVLSFAGADRAGNTIQLTRTVILDTIKPVVVVTSPSEGALLGNKEVTVTGTCEAGISLTVNGVNITTATGTFSTVVTLAEGANIVTIEGRDAAGNTVLLQLPIVIDITAPSLELVEPLDGFRTLDAGVLVVGLTEPGAHVTVNDQTVMVDSFGRFSTTITLNHGKNQITAVAKDDAGNTITKGITVNQVVKPASVTESGWAWTISGLLVALGIMFPLAMLFITMALRMRRDASRRD
jgi:hypothetical protein